MGFFLRMRSSAMLAPLIVGAAGFLQAFDANSVSVALPSMAKMLHSEPLALGSVITAYLVGAAAFLPLCGWLVERFGARRLFCTAIVMFLLTSLACGLSPDVQTLVLARFAQGCAGAMLLPVGRIIVLAQADKQDMLKAMGLMTTPIMLGPLLGPPLGGLIVTMASWRWLFFVNVPVALVGLALVICFIPEYPVGAQRRLDWRGAGLLSAALAGGTCGVGVIAHEGASFYAILIIAVGMAGALGYYWHARRFPHPIVPGHLFAIPTFSVANIGGLFPRLLVSAIPFLLALLFQIDFGLSAAKAGELVMASALGSLPARWLLGGLTAHFSFRQILYANTLLVGLGVSACAALTKTTPDWVIMALLFALGLTRSLQLVGLMALNYADIDNADMPTASTVASVSQQVAMSLGIAIAVPAAELGQAMGRTGSLLPNPMAPAFLMLALLSLVSLFWIGRLHIHAASHLKQRVRTAKVLTEEA